MSKVELYINYKYMQLQVNELINLQLYIKNLIRFKMKLLNLNYNSFLFHCNSYAINHLIIAKCLKT